MFKKLSIGLILFFIIFQTSISSAMEVCLVWDFNHEEEGVVFLVFYRLDWQPAYDYDNPACTVAELTATVKNLDPKYGYYFVVRAKGKDGSESDDSNEVWYDPNRKCWERAIIIAASWQKSQLKIVWKKETPNEILGIFAFAKLPGGSFNWGNPAGSCVSSPCYLNLDPVQDWELVVRPFCEESLELGLLSNTAKVEKVSFGSYCPTGVRILQEK